LGREGRGGISAISHLVATSKIGLRKVPMPLLHDKGLFTI